MQGKVKRVVCECAKCVLQFERIPHSQQLRAASRQWLVVQCDGTLGNPNVLQGVSHTILA